MENTGLTIGRYKDFPYRALVWYTWGFGQISGFSSPSWPHFTTVELQSGWGMIPSPSGVRAWGTQHLCVALEQGSEVGKLKPCYMASFCQAEIARALNVRFPYLFKDWRQIFSLSPQNSPASMVEEQSPRVLPAVPPVSSSNRSRLPNIFFHPSFLFQFLFNLTSPVSWDKLINSFPLHSPLSPLFNLSCLSEILINAVCGWKWDWVSEL